MNEILCQEESLESRFKINKKEINLSCSSVLKTIRKISKDFSRNKFLEFALSMSEDIVKNSQNFSFRFSFCFEKFLQKKFCEIFSLKAKTKI